MLLKGPVLNELVMPPCDDAIQAIEPLLSKKNDPLVRPAAAETLKKLKNRD